ncbi:hypothetical protein [Legionella parisiensis]|uniref:hypothetical protein n=1 Tax=Legionella parisiensis TaxID=45071 RepID=UPI00073B2512|nr:hypothetical protein [Legionella parisiensis]KTD40197.1 hypothetical protein Lpar_1514 [Legionella parisiensis]
MPDSDFLGLSAFHLVLLMSLRNSAWAVFNPAFRTPEENRNKNAFKSAECI